MSAAPLILALDTASPVVSVALASRDRPGNAGRVLAERSVEIGQSSRRLLEMVDEVLAETGHTLHDITGLVALRGPGSFTGLRVGLATTLGLHQALGVPAAAPSTLEILATAAETAGAGTADTGRRVVAVVDVLRGEWAAQPFTAGWPATPEGEPERLPTRELARFQPALFVGYGVDALEGTPEVATAPRRHPPALAPVAARLAVDHPPEWNASALIQPLYFRPPAVTLPKPRQGAKAPIRSDC